MSRQQRSFSRGVIGVLAVVAVAVAGVSLSPSPDRTVEAMGDTLGSGGEFHPLTPDRIFDSRDSGALATHVDASGAVVDIQVVGEGGLPAFVDGDNDGLDDNVLAVVLNITVVAPTQTGFLRAFGTGTPEGDTSVVNFFPGSRVPNSAVLLPGEDGKVSLRLVTPPGAGTAHVLVDVSGWFSTSSYGTSGSRMRSIEPIRVYDSALDQFGGARLGDRAEVRVPIRGVGDVDTPDTVVVPDDENVVGVVVNVTGVNWFAGSRPTFVSVVPDAPNGVVPTTSTLNLVPGQFRSNMAILPVGDDGAVHLFGYQGESRLVLDVLGYLEASNGDPSRAGRVVPLIAPFRAFDTRQLDHQDQPLGPAQAEDWSFANFVEDVSIDDVPVGAQSGLLGNLTATNLQRQYPWATVTSFMTAYPSPGADTAVPTVSNITITEGDTVPNLVFLGYGSSSQGGNSIRFYNLAGYIDYVLDVYAVVLDDEPVE